MSISAANCYGYRALTVGSIPMNPTLVSFAAWVRCTDTAVYRSLIHLETADGGSPSTGARFQLSGNAGLKCIVATGGSTQQNSLEPARYFYEGWYTGTRPWVLLAGWLDTSQSAADGKLYVGGTTHVATGTEDLGSLGLLDDIYLLSKSTINAGWGGEADSTEALVRLAYASTWWGYKLTDTDVANMAAATNPMDIGASADYRVCFPLLTQAGDGLVDDINGITLEAYGGSATSTWFDSDNPTVNPPSAGGGAIAAISHYHRTRRAA